MNNPPCADCKFWIETFSHGSSSIGECAMKLYEGSCGFLGEFDHCPEYRYKLEPNPDTITLELTPGELLECFHALRSMTRFNNTEQRDNNQSAIEKIKTAYNEQEQ